MVSFCSNCYIVGHLTVDCENETSTWWDYIAKLRTCEISDEFFGSWLENKNSQSSTPLGKNTDIKTQFIAFMQEFVKNPNSLSQTPPQTPVTPAAGSNPKKNRFEALYQWTPAIQAQIEAEKQKKKHQKKKPDPKAQRGGRGGRGGQGGHGGQGGNRGGNRGGRGSRGRGAVPVN
jgi:hypothetical protein